MHRRASHAIRIVLALALGIGWPAHALPARAQAAVREPQNIRELVRAAAKEGALTIAWGATYGGAEGARRIEAGIRQKYGVALDIEYSPVANGAALQTQVAQEVRAGHTASSDVFFHVRDRNLAAAAQSVDYRKYVPGLPEATMYFGRRAVVAVTVLESFIYNTERIPRDRVPASFADLLKPEWKGKIASSPYQGLFANYTGLADMFGHDGMLAYFAKFSGQVAGLITCGETDRVMSGEFWIFGLDCGDHQTRLEQRRGRPLGIIHPREGTAIYAFAPGIPLTAAHPMAARLFIAYLLSPEGQALLWDIMGGDNASLPGSRMRAVIAAERKRGVRFIETFGLDVKHPEISFYATEINKIINH